MMDEPIFRVQDRWERTVALTARGVRHIELRHPELLSNLDDIANAVTDPELVVFDRSHANREHYDHVIAWPGARSARLYLNACVEYGPAGGEIITAHVRARIKPGEMQRWP